MGLLAPLLSMFVLGVRGMGWIPLAPACIPVTAAMSVIPSASTDVTSAPVALTADIIVSATESPYVVYAAVYQLTALSLTITSDPLIILPGLSLIGPFTLTIPPFHFLVCGHHLQS